MDNGLEKRYGLLTAISMVVGICIGSGIFFKAQNILNLTGGNMPLGILAWLIGGVIMMSCAVCFSTLATKYHKVNGLIDYAEAMWGKKFAFMVGWYTTVIYIPCITAVLAWLSARYTLVVFGDMNPSSGRCLALACMLLVASYAVNTLSPVFAGKLQVSTTFVKLIPLALMAVVGTVYGLVVTPENAEAPLLITNFMTADNSGFEMLFGAVVSTAFAYEGWIIATTINSELKNPQRNLPLALIIGSTIVIACYLFYYIGVAGGASVDALQNDGATIAFSNIFGGVGGTLLNICIAVSCIGALNGLMLGCTRNMYSLAVRDEAPKLKLFTQVDKFTNMPGNSAVIGLLFSAVWLFYFFAANLDDLFIVTYSAENANWFIKLIGSFNEQAGVYSVNWFGFDSSELPVAALYIIYPTIFIKMMTHKEFPFFKRIVIPIIALAGSAFMLVAAVYSHKWGVLFFVIIAAMIMAIGASFIKENKKSD